MRLKTLAGGPDTSVGWDGLGKGYYVLPVNLSILMMEGENSHPLEEEFIWKTALAGCKDHPKKYWLFY